MPIDLAQVDWLYVVLLALFVAISAFLGGLLSFSHRGRGAVLSALFFRGDLHILDLLSASRAFFAEDDHDDARRGGETGARTGGSSGSPTAV